MVNVSDWRFVQSRYQGFWPIGSAFPIELIEPGKMADTTRRAFEAGHGVFFAPLLETQPLTYAQIARASQICLIQYVKYRIVIDIAGVVGTFPFFVEPFSSNDDLDDWPARFALIPAFLHSYYTTFNGMRAAHCSPHSPLNLPMNVTKWRRMSDFASEEGIPKRALARVRNELGDLDNLWIVIQSEWKQLVFVNGNARDGRLYAITDYKFGDFFELADAQHEIDSFCAHVMTGASDAPKLGRQR